LAVSTAGALRMSRTRDKIEAFMDHSFNTR